MPVVIYTTDANGKELTKYTLKDKEYCYVFSQECIELDYIVSNCISSYSNKICRGDLGVNLEYSGTYQADQVIKTFIDSEVFNAFIENKIKEYQIKHPGSPVYGFNKL